MSRNLRGHGAITASRRGEDPIAAHVGFLSSFTKFARGAHSVLVVGRVNRYFFRADDQPTVDSVFGKKQCQRHVRFDFRFHRKSIAIRFDSSIDHLAIAGTRADRAGGGTHLPSPLAAPLESRNDSGRSGVAWVLRSHVRRDRDVNASKLLSTYAHISSKRPGWGLFTFAQFSIRAS